jgi:hypothetical protein
MSTQIAKLPTLQELTTENPETIKDNQFMVLMNQEPPSQWLLEHPMIKGYKYLPVARVEYLLSRIFTKWWVEIRSVQLVANSVVVTLRLFVRNPITLETEFQDGVGATPIQTDKGAGASDWNAVKSDGVMKAAPSAESYALKDAAEKFGKIFGKDLGRKDLIAYEGLMKESSGIKPQDLEQIEKDLFLMTRKEEVESYAETWAQYSKNTTFRDMINSAKAKCK